ncbi:hypothetical protein HRbin12_00992 [bacterium HR12]|nr:hypothetical protein HRbin12_00992 [bacterium HR12]
MANYSSPAEVRARTGIRPEDLGYLTEAELDSFLTGLLEQVSDLMNRLMRRDWLAELAAGTVAEIPAGLHGVAADLAAASVREALATRQSPVVRIDDFAVRTVGTSLITPDVRERLRLYAAGGGVGSYELGLPDVAGASWSTDVGSL